MNTLEAEHHRSGTSYRTLCRRTRVVSYSSFLRWQDRQREGAPLSNPPGPAKSLPLEVDRLNNRLMGLAYGRRRTAGTGEVYREFQDQISRRDLQEMVEQVRTEHRRQEAALSRRVEWKSPGLIWSMDETELTLGELGTNVGRDIKAYWLQVRDLGSRYQFTPRMELQHVDGEAIARHLETLFNKHGAPLVLKRDNGGNLNHSAVNQVLAAYGVIPLNSPTYYPPYNGGIERAQSEFKSDLCRKLKGGLTPSRWGEDLIPVLEEVSGNVIHELNHQSRDCVDGQCACWLFNVGKTGRSRYDRRKRREAFDRITDQAVSAMALTGLMDESATSVAWRLSVESWLHQEGLIGLSQGDQVLPGFL